MWLYIAWQVVKKRVESHSCWVAGFFYAPGKAVYYLFHIVV
jgi:hypothetical protein